MPEESIITMHPDGKKGVDIGRDNYEFIRTYILDTIARSGEIGFSDLGDLAVKEISHRFEGRVLWYITTVKLDLEARGIIERIPKTSPQRLRMVK